MYRHGDKLPGYCDYLLPQLYFGFQNSTAPFAETAAFWAEQVTCPDVLLWIGICTYKIGQQDTWAGDGMTEWQTDSQVVSKELELLCNMDGIDGAAIYDYASTFQPGIFCFRNSVLGTDADSSAVTNTCKLKAGKEIFPTCFRFL